MADERADASCETLLARGASSGSKITPRQLREGDFETIAAMLSPLLQGDRADFEHASAFWALFEIANKLHATQAELGQLRELAGKHKVLSQLFESLRASEEQARHERERLAIEAQYLREQIKEMQSHVRAALSTKETNKVLEHLLAQERAKCWTWETAGWFTKLLGGPRLSRKK